MILSLLDASMSMPVSAAADSYTAFVHWRRSTDRLGPPMGWLMGRSLSCPLKNGFLCRLAASFLVIIMIFAYAAGPVRSFPAFHRLKRFVSWNVKTSWITDIWLFLRSSFLLSFLWANVTSLCCWSCFFVVLSSCGLTMSVLWSSIEERMINGANMTRTFALNFWRTDPIQSIRIRRYHAIGWWCICLVSYDG